MTYSSPAISSCKAPPFTVRALDRRHSPRAEVRVSAVEASAACKLRAEFFRPMLADPLDRREPNVRIMIARKLGKTSRATG